MQCLEWRLPKCSILLKPGLAPLLPLREFRPLSLSLQFSSQIALRCSVSVIESGDEAKVTVTEFLQGECGLSQHQLLTVIRRDPSILRVKSTNRAREAVFLLRRYGFTDAQLRKIVVENPSILAQRADEAIKPKLELIKSLGFSGEILGDAVSRAPRILNVKELARNIQYFGALFRNRENLFKAIRRDPSVLALDPRKSERLVNFLQQSGVPNEGIFRLISLCPTILRCSVNSTKLKIDYVRNLGLEESSLPFTRALATINGFGLEKLDEKVKVLASRGFEDAQIKRILRKCPSVIANSSEKLQKNIDYLVEDAGLSTAALVKYPLLLGLSLEKRIIPRHQVFIFLYLNGLFSRPTSLPYFISLPEERFNKYFVNGKDYTPKLREIIRKSREPL